MVYLIINDSLFISNKNIWQSPLSKSGLYGSNTGGLAIIVLTQAVLWIKGKYVYNVKRIVHPKMKMRSFSQFCQLTAVIDFHGIFFHMEVNGYRQLFGY